MVVTMLIRLSHTVTTYGRGWHRHPMRRRNIDRHAAIGAGRIPCATVREVLVVLPSGYHDIIDHIDARTGKEDQHHGVMRGGFNRSPYGNRFMQSRNFIEKVFDDSLIGRFTLPKTARSVPQIVIAD